MTTRSYSFLSAAEANERAPMILNDPARTLCDARGFARADRVRDDACRGTGREGQLRSNELADW